ncbi:MAG: FAD-binding protein, partial [Bacteroidetes bacterium]|nr:FAD-binding protein [Bacteroidota bacterium]
MSNKKLECVPDYSENKTSESEIRKTWKNCVAIQIVYPLKYFKPETLSELVEIIRIAGKENRKVRAIGAGHSFSEILQTTDFLVDCNNMDKPIELDKNLLKPDDILKQYGKNSVQIELNGDSSLFDSIKFIQKIEHYSNYIEVELQDGYT